jgi:hypothetical protein
MKRLLAFVLLLVPGQAHAAWTRIGTFMVGNNGTAGTTYAPTTSATLEAGNVGVCVIAKDETGSGTTDGNINQFTRVTDAAGNHWVKAFEHANANTSTAADGAIVAIWYTQATVQLTSGAAVTFTFSASTTRKAVTCDEFTVSAGNRVTLAAGSNGLSNDAADPGSLTDATGVAQAHLFVRGSACESNNTGYTADTDYTGFGGSTTTSTSNSGTAATSMGARGESRIATESTSAASDPTYVAADCASSIVALDEGAQTGFVFMGAWTGTGGAGSTTLDLSLPMNVAAGDLLVAFAKSEGVGGTTYAVAKNSGSPANTFTCDAADVNLHSTTAIETAVCYNLAASADSSATFRVTFGASRDFRDLVVMQFRPQSGETVTKDASNKNSSSGTSTTSGTITTTGTDEVAVAFLGEFQPASSSAHQINAVSAAPLPGSSPVDSSSFWYRILTSTFADGQATATVTSTDWCEHLIAFKSAAAAGVGCVASMTLLGVGCR